MNFSYFMPSHILFGAGTLNSLATNKLPGKKALIVISSGTSMRKNGYLDRVIDLLKKNGNTPAVVVFDKILPNPVKQHVMEGAALAKAEGCDFIIGLGGGSSIDSAKSIAVMAKNPGDYWDYVGGGSGKGKPVLNGALPVVAITTTAGTGTEADPWTVITKEDTNEKIGFGNNDTFPVLSIVDPELMLTVPPMLTAFQGFDAFCHAAEGYISRLASSVSDMFALKSIELLAKYLPTAVADGNNMEARTQVALANTLAGIVESLSSCTSQHSIEHAMSAYHPQLPHGAGLLILNEAYFGFFAEKIPQRFIDMARVMGNPQANSAKDFMDILVKMQQQCSVYQLKMSDYGIQRNEIEKIAKNAFETMGGLFKGDRYTLNLNDVIGIIEKAYK